VLHRVCLVRWVAPVCQVPPRLTAGDALLRCGFAVYHGKAGAHTHALIQGDVVSLKILRYVSNA
jgi:hypothetical protein